MDAFQYPHNWPEIAYFVKEANAWQCQSCGISCRRPGELNLGWQYQLTVAHYFHEYDTPTTFVVALCVKCHFLHDSVFVWNARRRWQRYRRQQAGQLQLV